MKVKLVSSVKKILKDSDALPVKRGVCLADETYTFQAVITPDESGEFNVSTVSDVEVTAYEVVFKKGNYALNKKTDDFYIKTDNDEYPDLLLKINRKIELKTGEKKTLFFEISASEKTAGEHEILILIGKNRVVFKLEVIGRKLAENDLIITHWIYSDCISNYYKVKPFSTEFYKIFSFFLRSYVKLGNNTIFVPVFTPPLDTAVGGERLTTQLVGVKIKSVGIGENFVNAEYEFDFAKVKKYIDFAKSFGIKNFEFSHLFTQWGAKFCPKIIAKSGDGEKRIFGWETPSADDGYLNFLRQYLTALDGFVSTEGIKENCFMHLSDEPHADSIVNYRKFSEFARKYTGGIKIIDALSTYDFAGENLVDMPAVYMDSNDYEKFKNVDKILYYCVWADKNNLTNRYFHMPALRTQILGFMLYEEGAKGFLHWGYNFYNTQFSIKPIDPYKDATAGGGFVAGDPFLVYPGKNDVDYSLRYFEILKAFEDYRLLKTVEKTIGREKTLGLLKSNGYKSLHEYARDERNYLNFKKSLYALLR